MHQILLGLAAPYLLAVAHYVARGRRAGLAMLTLWPAAMALGALWAVAPDIPRLLGAHDLYMRLADDPRTNIFFWHYTIDRIETDPVWPLFVAAATAASLLAAALRELRLAERGSPLTTDGARN